MATKRKTSKYAYVSERQKASILKQNDAESMILNAVYKPKDMVVSRGHRIFRILYADVKKYKGPGESLVYLAELVFSGWRAFDPPHKETLGTYRWLSPAQIDYNYNTGPVPQITTW